MKRILFAAITCLLLTSSAFAGNFGAWGNPTGCGGHCLQHFDKLHQHGPLFNYGPYYGYPPFEPYGPWNQYLQYGAYSGYSGGYSYAAPQTAPASDCPTCRSGAPIVRPQLAPTPAPAYGYGGSYNPYFPASYAPQMMPSYPAPIVPVMHPAR